MPQRYTVVLKCLEHPRLCVCLIRLYAFIDISERIFAGFYKIIGFLRYSEQFKFRIHLFFLLLLIVYLVLGVTVDMACLYIIICSFPTSAVTTKLS